MEKREAIRYLEDAKEMLKKSKVEDNISTDTKYVKSACGIAYLGVLRAVDEYLLSKALTKKELPKKVEEYEKAIKKHLSVHDGKLLRQFQGLYDELHIGGYYRGILHHIGALRDILKAAEDFVQKVNVGNNRKGPKSNRDGSLRIGVRA